jgi:hypothetical protein
MTIQNITQVNLENHKGVRAGKSTASDKRLAGGTR